MRTDPYMTTPLGVMYENGRGVDKDEKQAVEWYHKAAKQGYAAAQFCLGCQQRVKIDTELIASYRIKSCRKLWQQNRIIKLWGGNDQFLQI